ncbi:Putative cytochrome P450 [Septoria linicola]|uniref:Cytochrome P450 n=1 Tax=Septoria linicola TaxID=215465 RepID=A0A9Q9EQA1_9PEZI|nr:Putative cytochrome P450 [Septoria linicola]
MEPFLLQTAQHPSPTAIALLLASITLYTVSRILYNLFLHPIRAVPGPWWWAASSLPFDYHTFRGTAMHRILQLHQTYGKEIRIAPNEVSFASGQVWKEIYSARPEFPKDPKRTEVGLEPVKNIFMAGKEDHARYRRLLAHAFSAKGIKEQEPRFMGYIDLLVQRLGEVADGRRVVDMVDWFTMTVFDVLGDLTWGESFNGLKNRKVHEWVNVSMHSLEFFFKAGTLMKHYLTFLIPVLTDRKVLDAHKLNSLYSAQLTERRAEAGAEPRGDFWDKVLIKSGPDSKGDGMSLDEMKVNASFLILAGAETTATTLSGVANLLGRNPRVLSKLVEEIRTTSHDIVAVVRVEDPSEEVKGREEARSQLGPGCFSDADVTKTADG